MRRNIFKKAKKKPISQHTCSWHGCGEEANYPAPKKKTVPDSYKFSHVYLEKEDYTVSEDSNQKDNNWYCLEHIKKFNASWNFFDGMGETEIDEFQRDAVTGHRPSSPYWQKAQFRMAEQANTVYHEAWKFRNEEEECDYSQHYAETTKSPSELSAMRELELSYPLTLPTLKTQYRKLVKKYHPDLGGKDTEERFKKISKAYSYLRKIVAPPNNI